MRKKVMFILTLKLRNRQDGATVGLLLAYLYLGVFHHRCGDIELNPGPPKRERVCDLPPPFHLVNTLKDVITTLQDLKCELNRVREEVREVNDKCTDIHDEVV
ncbi:hypothetical protein ACOMHN_036675 [Nucella lapillus]